MSDHIAITLRGYELLKDELKHLVSVERPMVINAISEARAHGDLKENAEYHAAKEQQGHIEGRIMEINGKMAAVNVIDPTTLTGDKVLFGATVKLEDLDTEEEFQYQLVGEDEADLAKGMISYTSPIGKGLIGKKVGDEVAVVIPKGKMNVEILSVDFI